MLSLSGIICGPSLASAPDPAAAHCGGRDCRGATWASLELSSPVRTSVGERDPLLGQLPVRRPRGSSRTKIEITRVACPPPSGRDRAIPAKCRAWPARAVVVAGEEPFARAAVAPAAGQVAVGARRRADAGRLRARMRAGTRSASLRSRSASLAATPGHPAAGAALSTPRVSAARRAPRARHRGLPRLEIPERRRARGDRPNDQQGRQDPHPGSLGRRAPSPRAGAGRSALDAARDLVAPAPAARGARRGQRRRSRRPRQPRPWSSAPAAEGSGAAAFQVGTSSAPVCGRPARA